MKIKELISILENEYPSSLQEKYDNAGVQIVFPEEDINGVLFALDIDGITVSEAVDNTCNIIIVHHPLFFKPINHIDAGDPGSAFIIKCVENKITVFALHTNLDKIFHDVLARKLGFNCKDFVLPDESVKSGHETGFGALVDLPVPFSLDQLLEHTRQCLSLQYLIYSGDLSKSISRIAILNGAGGGSIEKILKNHTVDCIISGDITYHGIKYGSDRNVALIDAGHFGTETVLMDFLMESLRECLTNMNAIKSLKFIRSTQERNPFKVYPERL